MPRGWWHGESNGSGMQRHHHRGEGETIMGWSLLIISHAPLLVPAVWARVDAQEGGGVSA